MRVPKQSSPSTNFSCPDCSGVLKLDHESGLRRDYRCQVGHRFSTRSLLVAKEKEVEWSLWSATVTLQHIMEVYDRLLTEMKGAKMEDRRRLQRRIKECRQQQRLLIRMIENTHAWD